VLPAGRAVRVRVQKGLFKGNEHGGGQLVSWVADRLYIPIRPGKPDLWLLLVRTTAPRRIAEMSPLFLTIARTIGFSAGPRGGPARAVASRGAAR
jgi:hypothetical protein